MHFLQLKIHKMSKAFRLIIVGDEILSGRREDKHLSKVIELLGNRGLSLASCEYVGDERVLITDALKRAFASGDVVFCTGGIGATPDDHTRQCAAAALSVPLAQHPEATEILIERMKEMFAERNAVFDEHHPDNVHRLNMAVFPVGAQMIPNPYNKVAGFSVGHVHFFPGFPVMAWPMMEWVLDSKYPHLHNRVAQVERSVIVFGAMEATLTPLMQQIETDFPGVKVFSLPSVDHPEYGRHIDLGVKGDAQATMPAYEALKAGVLSLDGRIGPEMVR
jgi:molybdopterin-biosynthesis enzyme MoeA-like protein